MYFSRYKAAVLLRSSAWCQKIFRNDLQFVGNETTPPPWTAPSTIPQISLYFEQRPEETLLNNESSISLIWGVLQKQEGNNEYIWRRGCLQGTLRLTPMETMQGATFVPWPLPSNTILVSKSHRAQETTRLCWGLYDSNYIICPICYCFIHVRIICFGFLCNVLGFVYPPWETCYTVCALDRLFIKCPVFCQVDFPTMMHR